MNTEFQVTMQAIAREWGVSVGRSAEAFCGGDCQSACVSVCEIKPK